MLVLASLLIFFNRLSRLFFFHFEFNRRDSETHNHCQVVPSDSNVAYFAAAQAFKKTRRAYEVVKYVW